MPVELLQFGGFLAAIVAVAVLWFALVYKARRTGEGQAASGKRRPRRPSGQDGDEGDS